MKRYYLLFLIAGLGGQSTLALAHHSFAMFDFKKSITIVGSVERYDWSNPHFHITVAVAPGSEVESGSWDIEAASINIASRQGWTRSSFKAGDKITVVAHPLLNGTKGCSLMWATGADGRKLYQDINRAEDGPAA